MHGLILTGFSSHSTQEPSSKRTAGAHRIATYLRQRDWDVEVLEFIMGWNLAQLKEFAKSRITSKTVFVGFGGTFPIWSSTIESFFSWLRETYPNVKIIAGGQVSNLYKIKADWYVHGFGERAFEALLKHIVGNEPVKWQFGINGRKVVNGNLDYPSYPMGDLSIKYEDRDFILPDETLTTELGRGCVFNCSYCNFPILGVKTDHTRDSDNFYNELLDTYERFGVTKYIIADETVNDYSEKLEKFARVIKDLPFRPRMHGFARADLLVSRPHDWDTMIEMGFIGHHYGIETTNHKAAKAIGKGMDPEKLLSRLLEARDYFKKHSTYKSDVSLIAGLPHETRDSLSKTINWFRTNWKTESTILFPLYIPKPNLDSQSGLSFEYQKYGYRESSVDYMEDIRELYARIPAQYGLGEGLLQTTGMCWEHDEWDLKDIMEIVVDYYKDYDKFSGASIWRVGEFENILGLPSSAFADKTMSEIPHDDFESKTKIFIDNYIEKKLNWSPDK